MKKLTASWKNTQSALGYRVLWNRFWERTRRPDSRKPRRSSSQQFGTYGPLEPRQLLASVTLEGNVLTVDGTSGDDVIRLVESIDQSSFTVSVNDDPLLNQSFDYVDVGKVVVDAKGGDDFVTSNLQIPSDLFGRGGDDFLRGGSADDLIKGGSGNDEIAGRDGNDMLVGDGGDDTIRGGLGDDTILAGAGNDVITGNQGNDAIVGGTGDDQLTGGHGDDHLSGGGGNDTLLGGQGNDYLEGSAGDDSLYGQAGNDQIRGNDGKDLVEGQAGDDELQGNDGADTLHGGAGEDTLLGGAGKDTLYGNAGIDTIHGGEGSDIAYGGNDDDQIFGEAGRDSLYGNDGNDQLYGNEGRDQLFGNAGNDHLLGGDGRDELLGGQGDDQLEGNAGNDELYGQAGNDVLDGGSDRNVTSGGVGDDTYLVSNFDSRRDIIADTDGEDTLDLSNWSGTSGAQFSTNELGVQTITQGDSPSEVKLRLTDRQSIEHIIGTGNNDTFDTQQSTYSWTVTTLDDEKDGDHSASDLSLREALLLAQQSPNDPAMTKVIQFDEALFVGLEQPATLQLAYDSNNDGVADRLSIKTSVNIAGPGAHQLVIQGVNDNQIFYAGGIDAHDSGSTTIEISGLTLTGAGQTAVKTVGGKVKLHKVRIIDNLGSGVVSNHTNLHVFDSEILSNRSENSGAGIRYVANQAGDYMFELVHSKIAGNIADTNGGGVFVNTQSADSVTLNWVGARVLTNQAVDGSGLFLRDNDGVSNLQFDDVSLQANNGGPDVGGTADAVAAIEATGSVGDPELRNLFPSESVIVDLSEPLTTSNWDSHSLDGASQFQFASFSTSSTNSVIQSWTREGYALDNIDALTRPDRLQFLNVRFNQPVTVFPDALRIINDSDGGSQIPLDGVNLYYNSQTNDATWVFSDIDLLDPGYYTLSLNFQKVIPDGSIDPVPFDASFNQQIYVAIPGDVNLDGQVNVLGDAVVFVQNQGMTSGATWGDGDFNGDGAVNILGDGVIIVGNLNQSLPDLNPPMTTGVAATLSPIEPQSADFGEAVSIYSVVSDSDLLGNDTYRVITDWGDGIIESGISVADPIGNGSIAGGNHIYNSLVGPYSGTLTVVDSFGNTSKRDFLVRANNPAGDGNVEPVLATIENKVGVADELLEFSAFATDENTDQELTFSLFGDVPDGAAISSDGRFNWIPKEEHVGNSYEIIIMVEDNGYPVLSDTKVVELTVPFGIIEGPEQLSAQIVGTSLSPDFSSFARVEWLGASHDRYTLQRRKIGEEWITLLDETSLTRHSDFDLHDGTFYEYRVFSSRKIDGDTVYVSRPTYSPVIQTLEESYLNLGADVGPFGTLLTWNVLDDVNPALTVRYRVENWSALGKWVEIADLSQNSNQYPINLDDYGANERAFRIVAYATEGRVLSISEEYVSFNSPSVFGASLTLTPSLPGTFDLGHAPVGIVQLNNDFDEGNRNADGVLIADNQPDVNSGHRINTSRNTDFTGIDFTSRDELVPLYVDVFSAYTGTERSLSFPDNIKIWTRGGREVLSGEQLTTGLSSYYLIEGIRESESAKDVEITLSYSHAATSSFAQASVRLTVVDFNLDVAKVKDDVNSATLNSQDGWLEDNKEENGVYIIVNNDDDDDNDIVDSRSRSLPVEQENDLLPIRVTVPKVAVGGKIKFTITNSLDLYRKVGDQYISLAPEINQADELELLFSSSEEYPATEIDIDVPAAGDEINLFLGANQARFAETTLIATWIPEDGRESVFAEIPVNVIEIEGARNVIQGSTYRYSASGSSEGLDDNSVWAAAYSGALQEGQLNSIIEGPVRIESAEIKWTEGAVIGKARFQMSDNYVWAVDVNVIRVEIGATVIEKPAGDIAGQLPHDFDKRFRPGFNRGIQVFDRVSNLIASNGSAAVNIWQFGFEGIVPLPPAMRNAIVITNIEGPKRGGLNAPQRGLDHLEIGFIQFVTAQNYSVSYANESPEITSSFSGGKTYLDVTTPALNALANNVPVNDLPDVKQPFITRTVKTGEEIRELLDAGDDVIIEYTDSPAIQIGPEENLEHPTAADGFAEYGDDIATRLEASFQFQTHLAARTDDWIGALGSEDRVFIELAKATWKWDPSGDLVDGGWAPDQVSTVDVAGNLQMVPDERSSIDFSIITGVTEKEFEEVQNESIANYALKYSAVWTWDDAP